METLRTIKGMTAGLLACAAVLVLMAAPAFAGISGSKHDLGSGGSSQLGANMTTDEICVFCHTPHGSDTTAAVPLWNKSLPGTAYTTYASLGSTTIAGEIMSVGSVSVACLSCHDGTQAMDVMINKPGSGGYNAAGSELVGPDGTHKMTGTPIPVIGSDLKNDHPVGIQYGGNTHPAGEYTGLTTASINGKSVWWIEDTVDAKRGKDEIMLYTRDNGSGDEPFVECASCHDPHNDSTASATSVAFLRKSNAGSALCLTCHIK